MDNVIFRFQWGVVVLASLGAAIYDVRIGRIPNVLTLPLLTAGIIWSIWHGGVAGLGEAVGACLLVSLPYLLLFVFAGGGAGDAKLAGAIGAWVGLRSGLVVLFCISIAAVIFAIVLTAKQKKFKVLWNNIILLIASLFTSIFSGGIKKELTVPIFTGEYQSVAMPYGVAIFAGVCLAGGYILWNG